MRLDFVQGPVVARLCDGQSERRLSPGILGVGFLPGVTPVIQDGVKPLGDEIPGRLVRSEYCLEVLEVFSTQYLEIITTGLLHT